MTDQSAEQPISSTPELPFIVGIGASAGGLEAIERFLGHASPLSGVAYVFVQHLDPVSKSLLPEILQSFSAMPVRHIEDGQRVEGNRVYVAPPNSVLALAKGRLQLLQVVTVQHRQRPIDHFLRSLAEEAHERAAAVILSGSGTDGTEGIRAINAEGGLVVVQEPTSAAYAGMPRSAIETGLVDYVLAPEEMPGQIARYLEQLATVWGRAPRQVPVEESRALNRLLLMLRSHIGHDFLLYKHTTIQRRVERRMIVNQVPTLREYVRFVQQKPEELDNLFRELLIGVTQFFRDPAAFQALETLAIRPLIESAAPGKALRIWINGCSTGEEAYSIAMLVHEQMDALEKPLDVQIFATDINPDAIATARRGVYSEGIAPDVSPERLRRFFEHRDSYYRIKPDLRGSIVFAVQNAVQDPPFSNVDLLSCRNLLIYLGAELQQQLIPLLHHALKPEGYLFLGTSETLGRLAYLFKPLDAQARIFQPLPVQLERPWTYNTGYRLTSYPEAQPFATGRLMIEKPAKLRQLAEQNLLQHYSPAAVVVTEKGDILYFHERTGKYLEPAVGEASLNVLHMAREGLRLPLTTALRKAIAEQQEIVHPGVKVKIDGQYQIIDLVVRPLQTAGGASSFLLVVFKEAASLPGERPPAEEGGDCAEQQDAHMQELERELQLARDYLQATIEDLETSNEELTSTNEELQSSNEELQSTNEELTSAKEELQSVNEELVTVNSELENKLDELTRANNDLRNLLTSVDTGIIFLDRRLNIMRFNPAATRFVNLIETDIGRPFAHIVSKIEAPRLVDDAREVLDTLVAREKEIHSDGRWYAMRLRPYRTDQNLIDGVVITFSEVTIQKQAQQQYRQYSHVVERMPGAVIIADAAGIVECVNPSFAEISGFAEGEVVGQDVRALLAGGGAGEPHPAWSGDDWRGDLEFAARGGGTFWLETEISGIVEDGALTHLIAIGRNVSQSKRTARAISQRRAKLAEDGDHRAQIAVLLFDANLHYLSGDPQALERIGLAEADLEGRTFTQLFPGDDASELGRYYRSALRGDNVYFERQSDSARYGVQVMPLRDGAGQIGAGVVVISLLHS